LFRTKVLNMLNLKVRLKMENDEHDDWIDSRDTW